MRRYVFQDGIDSDQCGQTAETACKTVNPMLGQLHTLHPFVNQNLLNPVEDVWKKVLDQFQSIFDQMEKWEYMPTPAGRFLELPSEINDYRQLRYTCFLYYKIIKI